MAASSGTRLERIRWIVFFGGGGVEPESIADIGRPGGNGEGGGGPDIALGIDLEGDAVCAREGGGGGAAGFSGSAPA